MRLLRLLLAVISSACACSSFVAIGSYSRVAMKLGLAASIKETVTEKLPPGRPVGRFLSLFFDDTNRFMHSKRMGAYQVKKKEKLGCIFRTNLFYQPAVVVTDKRAMNQIFTHELNNTMLSVVPPHHQGINEAHTQFTSWLKPSLTAKKVATHEMTMELSIDNFLHDLKRTTGSNQKKFVKVVPLVRAFFVSMTIQIFMGTFQMDPELAQDIRIWAESSLAHPIAVLPWRKPAKAKLARKRILRQLILIAEADRHSKEPVTLIGKLLYYQEKAQRILDTEDIVDRMLTTVFVGADATASAAISMWKVLSLQPHVKDELKKNPEFIPIFVTNILQTYPPAPFAMRQVKEDLIVGNYTIPPDWFVVYGFAGALHASDPNDWLALERNVASWAFGGGPHRCPGRFLASQELVSFGRVLVKMDWTIKKRQNLKQHYNPGLFPASGLKVGFPSS